MRFEGSSSFFSRLEQVIDAPEPPTRGGAGGVDDEAIEERALEPVLEAADEATDATPQACTDAPPAARAAPAPPIPPLPVADLLKGIRVAATPEGGLRIDAPPESAAALAEVFGAMAQLLREGAAPAGPATIRE